VFGIVSWCKQAFSPVCAVCSPETPVNERNGDITPTAGLEAKVPSEDHGYYRRDLSLAALVSDHQNEHAVKMDLDRAGDDYSRLCLAVGGPFGVTQALGEYLWPTTVKLMPLPSDCVPTNEASSPEALRIVEYQRNFYRLSLQKMVVCRTPRKFPEMEPDFTEQAFDQNTRRRWLPLYVGCCSYQYRRHVAVVIAQLDEEVLSSDKLL